MADMLSQAEIDALLRGSSLPETSEESKESLSPQEVDALGEIGNISMGSSATALFTLLGNKVLITTPTVTIVTLDDLVKEYDSQFVAVRIEYTEGLLGSNLLIIKEDDVKVITDLMMGGEGKNIQGDLSELHLSAIGEAMNQMIGSAATSMSSMFNKRIDISPPKAFQMNFNEGLPFQDFNEEQQMVKISFKMVVGNLIDSEIMQLLPLKFAKSLVENLLVAEDVNYNEPPAVAEPKKAESIPQPNAVPGYVESAPMQMFAAPAQEQYYSQPAPNYGGYPPQNQDIQMAAPRTPHPQAPVNVQPAHFEAFGEDKLTFDRRNISMIMDVPLQITVELGRTHKLIREILEFGPGSIIELDKLAGEPVDILVNGKNVAKGEVVVIDESFGVRITDIADPSKRL